MRRVHLVPENAFQDLGPGPKKGPPSTPLVPTQLDIQTYLTYFKQFFFFVFAGNIQDYEYLGNQFSTGFDLNSVMAYHNGVSDFIHV